MLAETTNDLMVLSALTMPRGLTWCRICITEHVRCDLPVGSWKCLPEILQFSSPAKLCWQLMDKNLVSRRLCLDETVGILHTIRLQVQEVISYLP